MEWTIVVSLIVLGLALLVVEILFVPGTTLVGLLGFILIIIGAGLSFRYFGQQTGWATVAVTGVLAFVALYLSFKSNLWMRFSLKSVSEGVATPEVEGKVEVGQEGKAISALRPIGKAEIAGEVYEVKTNGSYADAGTMIKVLQVVDNQIIVEVKS